MATLLIAALALGQQKVDQGKPGTQGPWPVTGSVTVLGDGGIIVVGLADGGVVATYPRICTASSVTATTVVGGTSLPVPATAAAQRIYINVCNSAQNASTAIVKCRDGNTAPVFAAGNPGVALLFGDCERFSAAAGNVINCIADAAGRNVETYECVP